MNKMKTADGFDAEIGDFVWVKNSVEGRPPTRHQIGEILAHKIVYANPLDNEYVGAKKTVVFKLEDRAYWKFIGNISVYVGTEGLCEDGFPNCAFGPGYIGSAQELIDKARKLCHHIHHIETNRPDCVAALQNLTRNREINLTIYRYVDDKTWEKYDVDIKGRIIQPWPDEFFEIGFHCRFKDWNNE